MQTRMMLRKAAVFHYKKGNSRTTLSNHVIQRSFGTRVLTSNDAFLGRRQQQATTTTTLLPQPQPQLRQHGHYYFSTASKSEVEKFSGMSSQWWDPAYNLLIPMNVIRVKYIQQQCAQHFHTTTTTTTTTQEGKKKRKKPLDGLNCLDIGCGGGLLSESLARLGSKSVTSVDPSKEMVEAARQHAQLDPVTARINYRGGMTAEALLEEIQQQNNNDDDRQQEKKFDVVCLLEVIEHSTNPRQLLQTASDLVKPETGLLFVSTVNRTLKSYAVTIVGAEYIMGYVPRGTHDWHKYLSPQEIQSMLPSDLEEVNVSGMVLTSPPFNNQWNWKLDGNDTDMNWIGCYAKTK